MTVRIGPALGGAMVAFLILLGNSGSAIAEADCNKLPNTTYCKAQIDQLNAQSAYADAQRHDLQSGWHVWANNIGSFAGLAAGLGALAGVIYGFFQLRENLQLQRKNLELQAETANAERARVLDNQFLEVLKRMSDANPAMRVGAVPLLLDLADTADTSVSVPLRYVAKQLAAVLSVEDNPSVIVALENGLSRIHRQEPKEVMEAMDLQYFQERNADLALALAEYDAYGGTGKTSAEGVAVLSRLEVASIRRSALYCDAATLAGRKDYFGPDVRLAQLAKALRAAGRRLYALRQVLGDVAVAAYKQQIPHETALRRTSFLSRIVGRIGRNGGAKTLHQFLDRLDLVWVGAPEAVGEKENETDG